MTTVASVQDRRVWRPEGALTTNVLAASSTETIVPLAEYPWIRALGGSEAATVASSPRMISDMAAQPRIPPPCRGIIAASGEPGVNGSAPARRQSERGG